MSPPVALHLDSPVGDAFRSMKEHRYSGLPVVDEERRVIGYIDLLELALRYLADFPNQAPPNTDPHHDLPEPFMETSARPSARRS